MLLAPPLCRLCPLVWSLIQDDWYEADKQGLWAVAAETRSRLREHARLSTQAWPVTPQVLERIQVPSSGQPHHYRAAQGWPHPRPRRRAHLPVMVRLPLFLVRLRMLMTAVSRARGRSFGPYPYLIAVAPAWTSDTALLEARMPLTLHPSHLRPAVPSSYPRLTLLTWYIIGFAAVLL